MYGYLEGRYHHDVVFLSRAKTGHGMTIFDSFPRGTMSKTEISADLLCEERRLHELAAATCADIGQAPPVVACTDLLSDPRWDVIASAPIRPLSDAAARDVIPESAIELIERRRAVEVAAGREGLDSIDPSLLASLVAEHLPDLLRLWAKGMAEGAGTESESEPKSESLPAEPSPAPRPPSTCSCSGLGCGCGFYP